MANSNLTQAKKAKNDEFYTQYHDIEKEINAYLEYNPDVFRGKTILLPCDDPEWSNFTRFFAQSFEAFGIKKLISTSYAADSKIYKSNYPPTLFEKDNKKFNKQIQKKETSYQKYDNYDAIEVPFTKAIPSDFDGVMGVPISFLDKYNPEQFEILSANDFRRNENVPFKKHGLIKDKEGAINGKPVYVRILIKHKK